MQKLPIYTTGMGNLATLEEPLRCRDAGGTDVEQRLLKLLGDILMAWSYSSGGTSGMSAIVGPFSSSQRSLWKLLFNQGVGLSI